MPLRRFSVHADALRVGMSGTHAAAPPLREVAHVGVVERHVVRQAMDLAAALAQTNAELGLFAGDERRVEAADGFELAHAVHRVAAARAAGTDWRVPLDVAELVEDARFGEELAAAP